MATSVEVRGIDGRIINVFPKYDGIILPSLVNDPVKALEGVKNFPYQDGDLFVCSYPKTGSNWFMDMVAMLRNGNTDVMDIVAPFELYPQLAEAKSQPRTLLSHLPFRLLPNQHKQHKGKWIFVVRNPKDIAVSTFHFLLKLKTDLHVATEDWGQFLEEFMSGEIPYNGYIEYYETWDKVIKENPEIPLFIARYEDFKKDFLGNLRKLCKFLEIEASDKFLHDVIEANGVQNIKAAKEADAKMKAYADSVFKDGKMGFYRKGIVGDWKNMFTVAQSERYDGQLERMEHTMFHYDYSTE